MPPRFAPDSTATTAVIVGLVAMMAISTDLYLPSLPAIARDLGVSVADTQLTLSAFLVGIAFGQLAMGPMSDRFGRRPVLIGGTLLYTLASIGCTLATSIDALVALRVLQAVGACAGVVVGRALVRDVHHGPQLARTLALVASAMSILPAVGPILGGFVEAAAGWRWNFALLAIFGGTLFAAVLFRLPETNAHRDPEALRARRILTNFAGFLTTRSYLRYALPTAFGYCALFAFISGSSFVFIDVLGLRPQTYGFVFAAAVFGYFVGTRGAAVLVPRLGIDGALGWSGIVMTIGGVAGLGAAVLHALAPSTSTAPLLTLAATVFAIGFGLCVPAAQAGSIGPYPEKAGAASAVLGFLQTALAALAGAAVGHLHDGTPIPMAAAIALASIASAVAFRALRARG
ncbi:MAG: multidrug effflux MFS transporter [Alphaproteobacteria bacterium]|nr:multidrug effflux MFS transporter [Alphaproteobacteria bacterium]